MNSQERIRYSRQIAIDKFGLEGQERLLSSSVAIVGCGALGSMVAMQLAGAGVGNLVLSEFDTVDVSNLHRQFFYESLDCGKSKLHILSERIAALNPDVIVDCHHAFVDEGKARNMLRDVDFVVDATDNASTKEIVGRICGELGKPCCIGGVSGFHGQVMTILPGQALMSDIFDDIVESVAFAGSVAGVMGPAAALCASVQASEVIKHISGLGDTLQGKVMTFDLASNSYHVFSLQAK